MFEGIGDAVDALMKLAVLLAVVCVLSVPLAIWKAIEIVLWVLEHLHWE